MERFILGNLTSWLTSSDRKPIVLRGARQVGKTWLVRQLATSTSRRLVEVNFERNPLFKELFNSNNPAEIIKNLEVQFNQSIDLSTSLLFLDEIQAAPEILAKLRWFAEELTELPVIATGSLLEFVLDDHQFSMPVGRINYMYLEPMSFEEFLLADDQSAYYQYISAYHFEIDIPATIHDGILSRFKQYILTGGMPAVVNSWVQNKSFEQINQIQHDLIATYRDDFAKYKGKLESIRFDEIINSIPKMLGNKFVFSQVSKDIPSATYRQVLNLLEKARVCHSVISTSCNGLPLNAEANDKYFKEIFLDVGLISASLGLNLSHLKQAEQLTLVNHGGVAEQVVGQLLRTIEKPYINPALYYWRRNAAGSNAEIDYVIQHKHNIIPLEVKSGSSGAMKSLHLFMDSKKLKHAVRVYSDKPIIDDISVKNSVNYKLISIPFYLIGQLHRLLDISLN